MGTSCTVALLSLLLFITASIAVTIYPYAGQRGIPGIHTKKFRGITHADLTTPVESSYRQVLSNPPPVGNTFKAVVDFASTYKAWLFVNGRFISKIARPSFYGTFPIDVKNGDVIAVKATGKNGIFGVIASVSYKNAHHVTSSSDWKAHKFAMFGNDQSNWRTREFSSCKWNNPEQVPLPPNELRATRFPYKTGARYVWFPTDGMKDSETIFLRHVIGGETCKDNKKELSISGQSESGGNGNIFCRCKQTIGRKGMCWTLRNPSRKEGRCMWRTCDTKYECVVGIARASGVCIRRFATEKVIPTGQPHHCKTVPSNAEFYVPYH